eukprot:5500707-Alexandrium_andersonii.AAC.1
MIYVVARSVFYTAAHASRPNLRGRVVAAVFPDLPLAAAMTTPAKSDAPYPKDPYTCEHETGLRKYSAGSSGRFEICDQCGMRRKVPDKGPPVPVAPKACPG